MREFNRQILVPHNVPIENRKDLIKYLQSIEKTMNYVDDWHSLKESSQCFNVKTKETFSNKDHTIEEFQDRIIKGISKRDGTYFLINKN